MISVHSLFLLTWPVFVTSTGDAKLGDLNVSRVCRSGALMQTVIGTPYYMGPEVTCMPCLAYFWGQSLVISLVPAALVRKKI